MKKYENIRSMSKEWDFHELVEMLPQNGFLLEVGSFLGKSAVCWAKTFEDQNKVWDIHTVDMFLGIIDPRKMSDMQFNSEDERKSFIHYMDQFVMSGEEQLKEFQENISGWENITWQKKYVDGNYVPPKKPDAMFYDGGHTYDNMKSIFNVLGNIPFIFVDDCTDRFPETLQVIEELDRPFEIKNGMGVICG